MDKIKIQSAFFDFSFTVFDPKMRKLFCMGVNDSEYNQIQEEFVKEIKKAVRKYKNQAKKYLVKKGENNVDLLHSKRKAHLSKEKPMDMEK